MLEALIKTHIQPLTPHPTSLAPRIGTLQGIQCLLVDLYGTLFISSSGDIGAIGTGGPQQAQLKTLLDKYDINMTVEALLQSLQKTIDRKHKTLKQSGIDYPEVRIDEIWQEILGDADRDRILKFSVEFEMIINPVSPMPGTADLLDTCRSAGIHMGIISNAQFFTPLLFRVFLGSNPGSLGFEPDLTFFSFEHEVAKPSPTLFAMAAEALKKRGISADAAWVLGNDMLKDILPARNAGFRTALFAGDARSLRLRENHPDCHGLSPELIITRLPQLSEAIRQTSVIPSP